MPIESTDNTLQEGLGKNKEAYQTLFEHASDAIFIMKDERFAECNLKALEMFGTAKEQLIGRTPYDFSPSRQPDGSLSKDKSIERINFAISGKPQRFEWVHCRTDGTPFDTEISLNKINIHGEGFIQAIVRDVTERRKQEQELLRAKISLQEKEYMLRRVLDVNPNIIFLIDENESIIMGNKAFADFYGTTVDETRGLPQKELHLNKKMSPEEIERWLADNRKALEAGDLIYLLEYGHNHAGEGAWYRTRKLPLTLHEGRKAILVLSEDINEIKQNEEVIRKKEATLSRAQRVAHIGNWEWNLQTGRIDWSDEIFRIFGLEPQEVSFEFVKHLTHPDDMASWEQSINNALYKKEPFQIDFRGVRSDGSVCWIHNEADVIRDENGTPLRMFGTAQDVTEPKRVEIALKESETRYRTFFEQSPDAIALSIRKRPFLSNSMSWLSTYWGIPVKNLPRFAFVITKPLKVLRRQKNELNGF